MPDATSAWAERHRACPHLRKSPGCHAAGLEAVRGVCALECKVRSPPGAPRCCGSSSGGIRRACSRAGDALCSLSLCPSSTPPPYINHTHASFQLTVVEGGGLTQCSECEKQEKMRGHAHPTRRVGPHRKHIPGPLTLLQVEPRGGETWLQVHETSSVAGEGARGRMVAPVWFTPMLGCRMGVQAESAPHPMPLQDPGWLS